MNYGILDTLFEHYMLMKRENVREAIGDNRDIPMLLYVADQPYEAREAQLLCVVVPGGRDDVVRALASVMARAFIPYWAAIASDGYVAKDSELPDEYMHPGGLEEAFKAGIPVRECLTLTAADHEGNQYALSRSYWYDDDGDVWFNDDEGPGTDSSGPLIDALKDITALWGKSQAEVIAVILERTVDMN